MPIPVAVVMGAGASYDSHVKDVAAARNDPAWRFPLASELFSKAVYWELSSDYPGARFLATGLAVAAGKGPYSLEEQLRRLASDPDPLIRRRFNEIPLYIRDVIMHCDGQYLKYPTAHAMLVERLRPGFLTRAVFITTNYDTLIEKALAHYDPANTFQRFSDYVRDSTVLLKIHGSIDWFVPIGTFDSREPNAWDRLVAELDPFNVPRDKAVIVDPGRGAKGWTRPFPHKDGGHREALYPLMTAPLAGKSPQDIVAMPSTVDATKRFLESTTRLAVIGNSGLDEDLLTLLDDGLTTLDVVHLVAETPESTQLMEERFRKVRAIEHTDIRHFSSGFYGYLREGGAEQLVISELV